MGKLKAPVTSTRVKKNKSASRRPRQPCEPHGKSLASDVYARKPLLYKPREVNRPQPPQQRKSTSGGETDYPTTKKMKYEWNPCAPRSPPDALQAWWA
jgi:hypothetical protein